MKIIEIDNYKNIIDYGPLYWTDVNDVLVNFIMCKSSEMQDFNLHKS